MNIPLNLVTLPGRGELDVNVTAMYQGNVHHTVFTRNMEGPTGILGVGWSLPMERIALGNPGNGSKTRDGAQKRKNKLYHLLG